jgi:hypothetical protein
VKYYINRYVIDRRIKLVFLSFNAISVISWQSVLLVSETGVPGKTIDLLQVTDKIYHILLYPVRLDIIRIPVSPTNKIDCHDITEIALKLMSNTINLNLQYANLYLYFDFL